MALGQSKLMSIAEWGSIMRRIRLYSLLLCSVAVLSRGSDGYAFNRINGILIKHSNF